MYVCVCECVFGYNNFFYSVRVSACVCVVWVFLSYYCLEFTSNYFFLKFLTCNFCVYIYVRVYVCVCVCICLFPCVCIIYVLFNVALNLTKYISFI